VLSHYVAVCPRARHECRCKYCTVCITSECGVEMATISTSVVLEYCLANAATLKVRRYQFLHIQGGNGLTGGTGCLEGNLCHWGYWVGRCALLEVSEGKTMLLIRKYNALSVRAFFMRVPQQSLQNVTEFLVSTPQQSLQNVASYR
jgi:hypothetical protein